MKFNNGLFRAHDVQNFIHQSVLHRPAGQKQRNQVLEKGMIADSVKEQKTCRREQGEQREQQKAQSQI